MFENNGLTVLTSFYDLWDIFISTITDYQEDIVCILDAVDECEDSGRNQLIEAISRFCSVTKTRPAVKFLFTSRPFQDIRKEFRALEREMPTIHLSGGNEVEAGNISRELDVFVRSRMAEMGRLGRTERAVLEEELSRAPDRTYLWVYLIFDHFQRTVLLTPKIIRSDVCDFPRTLDEAYERILSKSRDNYLTRSLLHIIVGAARPLTLQEMAVAWNIDPTRRAVKTREEDPETRFRKHIKDLCGPLVVVVDSKIYLLHDTVREFLVHEPSPSPHSGVTAPHWKFSLHPRQSSRMLAEICIRRLSFSDYSLHGLEASPSKEQYIAERGFLGYAARFWTDHVQESNWEKSDWLAKKALSYFDPSLPVSMAWFEMYRILTAGHRPQSFTPLSVACYFGISTVVAQLLEAGADTHVQDKDGLTALHWASDKSHAAVVQLLLDRGAYVDAKDREGWTSLLGAAHNGHEAVVRLLLDRGACVDQEDPERRTAMSWAACNGHKAVVQLLLDRGANIDAKNRKGGTALMRAAHHGHDTVVRLLLDRDANIEAKNSEGRTALSWAASSGHEAVVGLLLDRGANIEAKGRKGWTSLMWAAYNGQKSIVRLLLDRGANIDAKNRMRETVLMRAACNGHEAVVRLLLDRGAKIEARHLEAWTSLLRAGSSKHEAALQLLFDLDALPSTSVGLRRKIKK